MILSVNFHLCSQISSIITTFSLISCSQRQDKVVTLHRGEEGVLKGKKKGAGREERLLPEQRPPVPPVGDQRHLGGEEKQETRRGGEEKK